MICKVPRGFLSLGGHYLAATVLVTRLSGGRGERHTRDVTASGASRVYVLHENDAWVAPLRQAFDDEAVPFDEWFLDTGVLDLHRATPSRGVLQPDECVLPHPGSPVWP